MIPNPKSLITSVVRTVTGGTDRSEAATKAAATRRRNEASRKATARKAAQTRRQRDARVDAMVEATRRD